VPFACLGQDGWSVLARETGIRVRDTDRPLARLVGGVLTGAKADSRHLADAHVIAAAVEAGGGVVLTGDPDDLASLAAPYPNITFSRSPNREPPRHRAHRVQPLARGGRTQG
jgi:hypothetical protein